MNITNMIELANHISESIEMHYHDISDIDYLIEELNKKRKSITKRMEIDALYLHTIITDSTFVNNVNDKALADFKLALRGVDELVKSTKTNI